MKTDFPIHILEVCRSLRFLPCFCFPVHCYSPFLALKVLTSSMFADVFLCTYLKHNAFF